jgi:hypothetical protein
VEFKPKFKNQGAEASEEQTESDDSRDADETEEVVDFPEEAMEAAS